MTDPKTEVSAAPSPSATQIEYTNLISYFHTLVKLTAIALAVIIAVGTWMFHRNLGDIREDAAQIATKTATEESKLRVEQAFAQNNINALIQEVATKRIAAITDRQIDRQLNAKLQGITERMELIGRISESETRMRLGFRSGYEELRQIIDQTHDDQTKRFALSTLKTTGEHFEAVWHRDSKELGNPSAFDYAKSASFGEQDEIKTFPDLVRVIRKDQNMNRLAVAFLAFREVTGAKVEMFDVPAVEKWCAQNGSKCEK